MLTRIQHIKEHKAGLFQDSLIKWRKSAGVQNFLNQGYCCGVCGGVCVRLLLPSTLCPLAFRETKIYVAFSSLPIYFYFTLELLQYRGDSPQVLKPSKISPLVEVKVPCLVCFLVERQLLRLSAQRNSCRGIIASMTVCLKLIGGPLDEG